MRAKAFRTAIIVLVAILALIMFAWPVLLVSGAKASGCGATPGACGATLVVLGLFGRQILALLFILSTGTVILVRARRAHIPWIALLPLFAAIGASLPVFMAFNNFWGAGFAIGMHGKAIWMLAIAGLIGPLLIAGTIIWNLASTRRAPIFDAGAVSRKRLAWLTGFSVAYTILHFGNILTLLRFIPNSSWAISLYLSYEMKLLSIRRAIGFLYSWGEIGVFWGTIAAWILLNKSGASDDAGEQSSEEVQPG